MPEKKDKEIGLSSMQRLDNEGYPLAKANLNLLNKSSSSIKKTVPNWIFEISKTKLPDNFQDARNILDSTFQKDKYRTLTCKGVNGDITYRKWKYINEESYIAIQYIFKSDVDKPLAENEINNLFLYCQSIFESSNNVYLRFGDVILIINPQKNIKYQIIKKL